MDLNNVMEMLKPFHEASVVYAAGYAKACGRNTVTLQDMEYGAKYAARYVVGVYTQSVFPEVYDEDSTDEDEELHLVSERRHVAREEASQEIIELVR